jgi:predicted small lipoprotein YifL
MKKLLLISAMLALAACGEKPAADAPPAETGGEMAPADTGMGGMSHDTATASDTTMARDTAAQ